jgi:Predicted phosphoadenosine phosphosulfate sulfotransferase
MRLCQPYGDDQRQGLWLFHLIEPATWSKVVARVNGANSGALYVQENGNINGYNKVTKPEGHTWESFARMLINSMPPPTKEHYESKVFTFEKWWRDKGYPEGIPDEADYTMEQKRLAPSWRRVCKTLLRNDYWCKGLGFSHINHQLIKNTWNLRNDRKKKKVIRYKEQGRNPLLFYLFKLPLFIYIPF